MHQFIQNLGLRQSAFVGGYIVPTQHSPSLQRMYDYGPGLKSACMQACSEDTAALQIAFGWSNFTLLSYGKASIEAFTGRGGELGYALTFGHQPPDLFGNVQPSSNQHKHATYGDAHLFQHQLQTHREALSMLSLALASLSIQDFNKPVMMIRWLLQWLNPDNDQAVSDLR